MFEAEAEVEAIFIEADHMYPLFPCDSLAGMIFWSSASNCLWTEQNNVGPINRIFNLVIQ